MKRFLAFEHSKPLSLARYKFSEIAWFMYVNIANAPLPSQQSAVCYYASMIALFLVIDAFDVE